MFRSIIVAVLAAVMGCPPVLANRGSLPQASIVDRPAGVTEAPPSRLDRILEAPGLSPEFRQRMDGASYAPLLFEVNLDSWNEENGLLDKVESSVAARPALGAELAAMENPRIVATEVYYPFLKASGPGSAFLIVGLEDDRSYRATLGTLAISFRRLSLNRANGKTEECVVLGRASLELTDLTEQGSDAGFHRWERDFFALPDDAGEFGDVQWLDSPLGISRGVPGRLSKKADGFALCDGQTGTDWCFCECVLSELIDEGLGEDYVEWLIGCLMGCFEFNISFCAFYCTSGAASLMATILGCWYGCS
jgi:hypothetical protein